MRREAAFARAAGPAGVCPRAADRRRRARHSCENVCPRAAGAPRQCAHFRVRGRPAAARVDGNARPDDERPFGFVCKNGRRRWCAPAHERRCVACGARTRSPRVDASLALSLAARSGFLGFRDALGARCRRSDAGALPHVADLALAGVSERGLRLAARLCPNLKRLDVSGCAGGGDAAVLAALLERCPKLETLVVGAVGAAGLRTLAALGLRSLSVGDFGYGDLGPLAAALDGAPPTLKALRVDCHHFCFAGWAAPPPASAQRGLRSVERLRVASAWGDPPCGNLQPDFNVHLFDNFDTISSAALRELDASDRFVQKSPESTSMWPSSRGLKFLLDGAFHWLISTQATRAGSGASRRTWPRCRWRGAAPSATRRGCGGSGGWRISTCPGAPT